MNWQTRDDLHDAIEALDSTVHGGAPIAFSNLYCFANVDDVCDLVWPEIERLRTALRELVRATSLLHAGDGTSDALFTVLDRRTAACAVLGIDPGDPGATVELA